MSVFSIYENKSHNDVEIKKVHEIEELLVFNGLEADILVIWFYGKDGDSLKDTYGEGRHYVEFSGTDFYDIIVALRHILESEEHKELLSLYYFPLTIPYYVGHKSKGLFGEEYFKGMSNVYDGLCNVMRELTVSNRERLFYYNIK